MAESNRPQNQSSNNTQNSQDNYVDTLITQLNGIAIGQRNSSVYPNTTGQQQNQNIVVNNVSMSIRDAARIANTKTKLYDLIKNQNLQLPTFNVVTITQLTHNWINQVWLSEMRKAPRGIIRKNCIKVLNEHDIVRNDIMKVSETWNAQFLQDLAYTLSPQHPCWNDTRYNFNQVTNRNTRQISSTQSFSFGNLNIPGQIFQDSRNVTNQRVLNGLVEAVTFNRQIQQNNIPSRREFLANIPQQQQTQINQVVNNNEGQEPSRFLDYDGNFALENGEQLDRCPICLTADDQLRYLRCCGQPMHQSCLAPQQRLDTRCPCCRQMGAILQRRPVRRGQAVVASNMEPQNNNEEQKNQDEGEDSNEQEGNSGDVSNQSQDV